MMEKPELKGDLLRFLQKHGGLELLEEAGGFYVPIRPVCEILGLAFSPQHRKLTRPNATTLPPRKIMTLGADGKSYEMFCLSWTDFIWWLIGLDGRHLKEEARAAHAVMRQDMRHLLNEDFKARVGRVPQ